MEKRKPTFDLASIKAEFSTVASLRMTVTAANCAQELGIDRAAVVVVIQSIARSHFFKSMTTNASSKVWQDVYHVPHAVGVLYVKFTVDGTGHLLISFKRKDG